MQDINYNNFLVSESNLIKTPQDTLKNSQKDYTSIFGNARTNYASDLSLTYNEENENTPFAYDTMMDNIFGKIETGDEEGYEIEDDEAGSITLGFEC